MPEQPKRYRGRTTRIYTGPLPKPSVEAESKEIEPESKQIWMHDPERDHFLRGSFFCPTCETYIFAKE